MLSVLLCQKRVGSQVSEEGKQVMNAILLGSVHCFDIMKGTHNSDMKMSPKTGGGMESQHLLTPFLIY